MDFWRIEKKKKHESNSLKFVMGFTVKTISAPRLRVNT